MEFCNICPNNCGVQRNIGVGACNSTDKVKIAKYYAHAFEEPVISGVNGSGTVFFCGCSLKCVLCQNYEVSRNLRGKEITDKELADIFFELEKSGVHNINLVNPTHYAKQIISALKIYKPNIPIVYNTHGYEKLSTLEQIDEYIDIYLPDLKYFNQSVSKRYTGKNDYFEVAIKAINFMANKPLIMEGDMLKSGTVVRHLILPQNAFDSVEIVKALSPIKEKIYCSLMSQYTPFGDIENFPELKRRITAREYNRVLDTALNEGFTKMFVQDKLSATEEYIPSWDF